MDGTRMGSRSSTRHGPAAVFSGPVRRWRKVWAPLSSSSSSTSTSSTSSRILLYKWVPINSTGGRDEAPDEPTPPIVRYMPVSIVLAQRKEGLKSEEEVEIESQKIDEFNSEAQVVGEGTDLNVVASESKASEPDEADVQEQLNDTRNETASEMRANEDVSPRAGGDVLAMIDEQNESEPKHKSSPVPDLGSADLPSD